MSRPYPCPRLGPGKCCITLFCPEFCKMTDRELLQCLPKAQAHLRLRCQILASELAKRPTDKGAAKMLSVYRRLQQLSMDANGLKLLLLEGFCVFCLRLFQDCSCRYASNPRVPLPS
ncbi:hypothetical protein PTSG_12244 [Salpingoeca rosetta]|uniref:Uncharacterized protein n=1 Tax=Salpingoeca rosetta (strain ATCC 50818 / BSB-021) TaxID=946362 RepID=F2U9B7_SALR5|nr:uncharacterized protein PTSG_12244 [Salpingoeca rosetta]EGD73320.1 hypothetical protein PTSG_12244 [Salpingoeca rosetta]|eukprot:XP_004994350.1 hypothetical protein PTSG_12244 [Salpingoeca rosetta]